jgi:GNAT superfamily N-acetyltransferase
MVLAFDPSGERPIGCASSTVRDGIATLGGMSTIPAARRRGVQAALVRHRLARAATLGCELAAATAAVGSASERNLVRLGFEAQFAVETWTRHGGRGRAQPGSFTGARRTGSPTSAS